MWPTNSASSCGKLHLGARQNSLADARIQALEREQVDAPPAEQPREVLLEGVEPKEARDVTRLELHEDIDVACRTEVGSQPPGAEP